MPLRMVLLSSSSPATAFSLIATTLLLSLAIASGCRDTSESQGRPDADSSRAITDDLGRDVAFTPPATRILPLAPNLTEMAFAAGAGEYVVAVGPSDDFPPAVDSLPHVSVLPVDFEAVVALEPELVLGTTQVNATRDSDMFDALDVPVYYFAFPTVESVFAGIRTIGTLTGTPRMAADSADALAAAFDQIQRESAKAIRSPSDRPRVLVLAGSDVLYSFGKNSYIHTLVDAAGGQSVTADMNASAPTLSEEFVLTAEPDVIVGAFGDASMPETLLEHHPAFDALPAVQNGRVYSIDGDLIFRPGPRLVKGTRRLAQILQPGRIVRSHRIAQ